jgi:hypothetical protein
MKNNKIGSGTSTTEGQDLVGGRKYGTKNLGEYQMVGGYKPSSSPHNPTPSDKSQNRDFKTNVDNFGKNVAVPKLNIDLKLGSWTRGTMQR